MASPCGPIAPACSSGQWPWIRTATTIRYNSGGAVWTNRFNTPANLNDSPNAIAVDAAGNVFVTGFSYTGAATSDFATIKYSNAGAPLWTNRYTGPFTFT